MKILKFSLLVWIVVFLSANTGWAALFGGIIDGDTKGKIEAGLLNKTIAIVPQINMLSSGYGNGRAVDFYFVKSNDNIFFQTKRVEAQVTKIEFDGREVTIHLFNPLLGGGKVKFVFDEEKLRKAAPDDLTPILAKTLADESYAHFLCSRETRMCHLHTCNHLPENSDLVRLKYEGKIPDGYRLCGFCFGQIAYLPESRIEAQLQEELSSKFPAYEPVLQDAQKQKRVSDMGRSILKNWPFRLLGRSYSFKVLDSPKVNAVALPRTPVIIYSGLLDSLENDEELESVLVHEIAHVEKRHALKNYKMRIQGMQEQEAIAAMAGMAAGAGLAAGSSRHGRAGQAAAITGAAAGLAAVAIMASHQNVYGYHQDLEREADYITALYFDRYGRSKTNLAKFFKKAQFRTLQIESSPDSKDKTHPVLSERIDRVHKTAFQHYGQKSFTTPSRNKNPVELTLYVQSIYQDENRIYAYLSDPAFVSDDIRAIDASPEALGDSVRYTPTGAIEDKDQISVKLMVHDRDEIHDFLMIPEKTTRDARGAHLVFEKTLQAVPNRLLKEPGKIHMIMQLVNQKRGVRTYDFIFYEGKIEF